jgi:hypothetical protein
VVSCETSSRNICAEVAKKPKGDAQHIALRTVQYLSHAGEVVVCTALARLSAVTNDQDLRQGRMYPICLQKGCGATTLLRLLRVADRTEDSRLCGAIRYFTGLQRCR